MKNQFQLAFVSLRMVLKKSYELNMTKPKMCYGSHNITNLPWSFEHISLIIRTIHNLGLR